LTERNLLIDPCWSAKDLGEPLPSRPHAVSVALPRWEDVIAYEEKVPACINSLKAIYPRFGFNPFVAEIARKSLEFHGESKKSSWPYPNRASALSAQEYCLRKNSDCFSKIEDFLGVSCLIIDQKNTSSAKAFWQHTGLGLSSREAAIALGKEKKPLTSDGDCAREELIKRLANIYNCDNSLIRLHRSGMAALTTIISAINCIKGTSSTLQIGFPYVDVLKLPQMIFQ
jgi:cystathionine gamma-synthase